MLRMRELACSSSYLAAWTILTGCRSLLGKGFKENFGGSHYPSLLRHRRRDSPDGRVCDRLRFCRCRDYGRQSAKLNHRWNCVPARRRGLVLPPLAKFASVWSSPRLTSRRDHAAGCRVQPLHDVLLAAVIDFADGF